MQYTVITGASSGIGKALAYKFAAQGHNLIITARREAELQAIKDDIEQKCQVNVIVYTCDLSESGKPAELYEKLRQHDVNVLINNAGFGDFSLPWDMNLKKADTMIDLNIKALTELSLRFAKDHADDDVTLINVASVGGYYQFTPAVTYCATKFYVSSFTEGIAAAAQSADKPFRAKVLAPGATESEFGIEAAKDAAMNPDDIFTDKSIFITSEQLAEYAYELYESEKVVGMINAENTLDLLDPVFPLFG